MLDIAAWNYPLLIAVNVIVPALLAGNAVLVKATAPEFAVPLIVAVKLAQDEPPVWHTEIVLVPAAMPVKLSWDPLKFTVRAPGLEMLEI